MNRFSRQVVLGDVYYMAQSQNRDQEVVETEEDHVAYLRCLKWPQCVYFVACPGIRVGQQATVVERAILGGLLFRFRLGQVRRRSDHSRPD